MNISIKPIKVSVYKRFLYDNDTKHHGLINGEIIGVSSYVGSPLTFHVMIDNKYLYSDMPIIAFFHGEVLKSYDLKTLSWIQAPAHELENFTLSQYMGKPVKCYLKHSNCWDGGIYVTSFDFFTDNELLHLIKLETGMFALVPNHKINWGNKPDLSDYKKNHQIYNF